LFFVYNLNPLPSDSQVVQWAHTVHLFRNKFHALVVVVVSYWHVSMKLKNTGTENATIVRRCFFIKQHFLTRHNTFKCKVNLHVPVPLIIMLNNVWW